MTQYSPPFVPVFGSGPPSVTVPGYACYYDTTTNPYTPYIFDLSLGQWKIYGAPAGGSGNAQSLQGIPVSATPPLNGQVLQYIGANSQYEPTTPGVSGFPTIIQQIAKITPLGAVTFPNPPAQDNLLVAIITNTVSTPNPSVGWTELSGTAGASFFYKTAGAGESATQQPVTSTGAGSLGVWEIKDANVSLFQRNPMTSVAIYNVIVNAQKGVGSLIIGLASNNANAATVSVTGATQDVNITGSRSICLFHVPTPVIGANAIDIDYGTTQTGYVATLQIG